MKLNGHLIQAETVRDLYEQALKYLVDGSHIAEVDHGARDVRPTDRLPGRVGEYLIHRDRQPNLSQARAEPFHPAEPLLPEPGERLGQILAGGIDEVTEDVNLCDSDVRAHLDRRNDHDPAPVVVGQRQVRIHRIVVGNGDGGKPGLRRQVNELTRRLETV